MDSRWTDKEQNIETIFGGKNFAEQVSFEL